MQYLFIAYLDRSGSSFLVNELSKYKFVVVCPESGIIQELLLDYPQLKVSPEFIKRKEFDVIEYDKLHTWGFTINSFLEKVKNKIGYTAFKELSADYAKKNKPGAEIIVYKHNNLSKTYLRLVKDTTQSDIYHIGLIRDPRDIFVSQKAALIVGSLKPINTNPLYTALTWKSLILSTSKIRGENNLIIKYEDLIHKPQDTINIICEKFNLMLGEKKKKGEYKKLIPEKLKALHTNINKSPQKSNIGKWKDQLSKIDIEIIERTCKMGMLQYGYSLNGRKTFFIIYFIYYIYYKLRIAFKIDGD